MSGPSLDFWAYHNRLREVHPGVKLTFVAVAMGVILTSGPGVGLVAFFMAAVLTLGAGVPLRLYLRLLILPLGFLVPGVLAIILDTGAAVSWAVSVAGMRVGVTETGLVLALKLGLRSLAAVSCLYFLALTTPLPAVLGVLRRVGVPALALEIAALTYRYLFVLVRVARGIYFSQTARGGYGSARGVLRSLGLLTGQLFLITHQRAQVLYTALLARGYQDMLLVPPQGCRWSGAAALPFAGLAALLVLLRVFWG
ncbi:MAG: cobalt ECF transporter T component CbiQ [Thermoanaerobacteraceae bacterium]|nr:cobalt ECF transporter T component CbiQ [Thermoanaerobacteraceae bacterium]